MTPVRLEPTAFRSRVKHSTTELLHSTTGFKDQNFARRALYESVYFNCDENGNLGNGGMRKQKSDFLAGCSEEQAYILTL